MIITRESEYAIRMVRALADNEIKNVRIICDLENIPHKFAYKILKKMENIGIVEAFQGVKGGYRLDKDISQITMLDILRISKNTLHFSEGIHRSSDCSHHKQSDECSIRKEFKRVDDVIRTALSERTMDKVIGV